MDHRWPFLPSKTSQPGPIRLSDRAKEFLDHWEAEHVNAVPNAQKRNEAERLVKSCLADANRAGIIEQDLEEAADGNLFDNMLKALQFAERQQTKRAKLL